PQPEAEGLFVGRGATAARRNETERSGWRSRDRLSVEQDRLPGRTLDRSHYQTASSGVQRLERSGVCNLDPDDRPGQRIPRAETLSGLLLVRGMELGTDTGQCDSCLPSMQMPLSE